MFGLETSSLVTTGVLITCAGFILNYLRSWFMPIWDYFIGKYTTTIEVRDAYHAHFYISLALAQRIQNKKGRFKLIASNTNIYGHIHSDNTRFTKLVPGYGLHFIKINNKPVLAWIQRRDLENRSESDGKSFEEMTRFWMPFSEAEDINLLVEEGMEICKKCEQQAKTIKIYHPYCDTWKCSERVTTRKLDSIILPDTIKKSFIDDAGEFFDSKDWYENHGIPYRRGYLLYGPPGTGKSSLVSAMAGHFKCNIYTIPLASYSLSDSSLLTLMRSIEPNSIVLFEDIDRIKISNEEKELATTGESAGITLSGLLNAIDGIVSGEGYVLVMTANHPEKLDEALVRAGRIDKKIKFNKPRHEELYKFIDKFYDGQEQSWNIDSLAERMFENDWSMADAQSYLLENKKSILDAINNFKSESVLV